jgi:hypothetical protein
MKRSLYALLIVFMLGLLPMVADAQGCSVCTRTAGQMGDKPAGKLNAGILYLAATPLAIGGLLGFWWWKRNRVSE